MNHQHLPNLGNARQRRISAITVSSTSRSTIDGSKSGNHNALRRTKTADPVASPLQIRIDKIRHQVIGFLGRKLTVEEEEVLQKDCAEVSINTDSAHDSLPDHQVASQVVQNLFSAYCKHASQQEHQQTRSSSIQLEAEAVQVETMAVLKMQASVRGYLRRQWYKHSTTITGSARQLAKETTQKWMQQQHDYNSSHNHHAATQIQAWVRRCLSRKRITSNDTIVHNLQETKEDRILEQPQSQPRPAPTKTESIRLTAIPETVQATTDTSIHDFPTMDNSDTDDSARTHTSHQGMLLWSASQQQLSHVTENVKETIVIKVQALVRRFLVRRRRRRQLRKAQSLRMLSPSRPTLMQVLQGTPQEHQAATKIQRIFRGFVQRWKYWYAMRQQQLEEILSLRAKQLRKIEERKKSVLKNTKKEASFDATSLARQLQRAKRVIKFLVKEEKRQLQQNERLALDLKELATQNQQLELSNQTTNDSVQTLQSEIQQLQSQNDRLLTTKNELSEMIQNLNLEVCTEDERVEYERQQKGQVVECIEKVKERAHDFLLDECPELLESL